MRKFVAISLSFFLVFLPVIPTGHLAYAEENLLTNDATTPAVPTVPAPDYSAATEVVESEVSSDATTDFLQGGGPLSRAEGEEEQVFLESNDPFYGTSGSWGQSYDDLWWLKRVRADQAWSLSRGTNVPVAVIDTGLDYNHPDIAANRWFNLAEVGGLPGVDDDRNGFVDDFSGWDYYNRDNDPLDDNGHGTHVSGIIAAVKDNGIGIAGIAPESKVIPIKVLNNKGSGFVSDVINAIYYAANLGAKVINMSLGVMKAFLTNYWRTAFENAVAYAIQKGSVVVAAAGNSNSRVENFYPAGIKDVIAVGATDVTNTRASFSNFGKSLDFVGPGVDILSLKAAGVSFGSSSVVDPNYVRASGTSMASPMVAGTVALLRAYYPLITPTQVYERLKASAVDLGDPGFDIYYGYGLVDAYGALTVLLATGSSSTSSSTSSVGGGGGTPPGRIESNSAAGPLNTADWPLDAVSSPGRRSSLEAGAIGTWYEISALRSRPSDSDPFKKKRQGLSRNELVFWWSRPSRPN